MIRIYIINEDNVVVSDFMSCVEHKNKEFSKIVEKYSVVNVPTVQGKKFRRHC